MNVQSTLRDDASSQSVDGGANSADQPLHATIYEFWQIARIRRNAILGAGAAVFALIVIVTFALTPLYTGTADVMVNTQQQNVTDIQAVLSGLPSDQATIINQINILQSSNLARRVIDKLRLDADPEFNAALPGTWRHFFLELNPRKWLPIPTAYDSLTPEQKREVAEQDVIDQFERDLSVKQMDVSTSIEIKFESEDPVKAAYIANAIADAYVDDDLNAKFEAAQKATQWLSTRLKDLAQKARAAQSAVEAYKVAHHITDVEAATGTGTVSVLDQQINAINTQLIQARTDRAQAEATLERVRSLVASGHADEVSQVVNSPLITQLREQQATLVQQQAQLASRYGPDHPKMLDIQAEKRDVDRKIAEEIQRVVATAANDVSVASSREIALQETLKDLENKSGVQGSDRVQLDVLSANALSAKTLYDDFSQRAKQTQAQEGLQLPDARVISRAAIPIQPSFPKKWLIIPLAAPISLLFGFIVALFMERLDHGFRTTSRLEETLGLPVLSALPDTNMERRRGQSKERPSHANAADLVIDKPLSAFSEAIRGVQLGLTLSNVDLKSKVVLVTSAIPGEGKSTTALALARHAAQNGQKVVLLDGDLRRPSMSHHAGVEHGKYDLVDVLSGECTPEAAMVKDTKSDLLLLPVRKNLKNAPRLLESQAMQNLLVSLRATTDFVVVDSAPILPVNDTKVLCPLVDSVLFVVRWERTPRDAVADAIKALKEIHAPIAGLALCRTDAKRYHYYSFGYGGYYYNYSKYYESSSA